MKNLTLTQKDNILRMILSIAKIDGDFNESEIQFFNKLVKFLSRSEIEYPGGLIDATTIIEDWLQSPDDEKYYIPNDPEEIAVFLIFQYMMVIADGIFNDIEKSFVQDFILNNFSLLPDILPKIEQATRLTIEKDSLETGSDFLIKAFDDFLS